MGWDEDTAGMRRDCHWCNFKLPVEFQCTHSNKASDNLSKFSSELYDQKGPWKTERLAWRPRSVTWARGCVDRTFRLTGSMRNKISSQPRKSVWHKAFRRPLERLFMFRCFMKKQHTETWQVLSQTRPYLSKGRNCHTICRSHCVMYVPSWTPALDSLEGFLYTGWSKLGPSYYPPQQRTSHNTSQVQSHHFPAKLPCLAGSFQNPWKLIVKPHSFKTQMTGRIRFWYREPKSMTFEADGSHLSLCNWDYWRRFRWNCGVRRRDTFSNWVWGRWLHHYVWAEIFLVLDLEVFGQNCLQIIPLHVRMYVDIL